MNDLARLENPALARAWCHERRAAGKSLALIPTMGALHAGHLSLVQRAAIENDLVCVSVFVNPLQFGEAQDFDRYPREFEKDCDMLRDAGAHMAFTGTLAQFFEGLTDGSTLPASELVDPGSVAQGLEGEFRVGHFEGVATIVKRLFEITTPTRAYFGAKDFQQTLVVRELSRGMDGPEIVVCPTLREPSGLAQSSRNAHLEPSGRAAGLFISRALFAARALWAQGERRASVIEAHMQAVLAMSDLLVEYAAVRDPRAWTVHTPQGLHEHAVALIAARAGAVRLIDNMNLHAEALPAESLAAQSLAAQSKSRGSSPFEAGHFGAGL